MMKKRMLMTVVALMAMTALFMVGCSDQAGRSVNPADVVSTLTLDDDTTETAWAFDCFEEGENAACFIGMEGVKGNKWGWTNGAYAPDSTYYFDLYAAAGQCDIDNGYLVGFVMLDYDGTTAEVTYETHCDFLLTEVHLWVGTQMLPMQGPWKTTAPGQFPWGEELDPGQTTYTFTVDGFNGEDIYMAAHAVVEGDFENYDCDAASVCDDPPPDTYWYIFGVSYIPDSDDLYQIFIDGLTSDLIHETGLNPGLGSDENVYPNGLGYDGTNHRLYYASGAAGGAFNLYFHDIDGVAGNQTTAGPLTTEGSAIASGVWYDGNYYYIPQGSGNLYMVTFDGSGFIDTNTIVAADFTGNGTEYTFGDIEVWDGVLYGSAYEPTGSTSEYFSIDLGTYNYTFISYSTVGQPDSSAPAFQLAFGPDGTLYAHDTGSGEIYEVDLTVSPITETLVGTLGADYSRFTDLASGPGPMPLP